MGFCTSDTHNQSFDIFKCNFNILKKKYLKIVWKFGLIPRILSARRISGIFGKLWKIPKINRQKTGLLFYRVETKKFSKICKTEPVHLFTTEVMWYNRGHVIQQRSCDTTEVMGYNRGHVIQQRSCDTRIEFYYYYLFI